jgi:hypothetical protein
MLAGTSPDRIGDIPTWIAGIGTVAAVIVALWLAIRDSRRRDAERRRAQAEKVGAWFRKFDPSVFRQRFRLGNASEQSAYRVVVSSEAIGKPSWNFRRADPSAFRALIGVLPPGGIDGEIDLPPAGGVDVIWALEVAFRDAAGRCWVRSAAGQLREIKADPVAHYGLKDVSWS